MWSDDNGPFTGKHYQLKETLCSPRPLQRPRPRILVGGSGEKRRPCGADPDSTKRLLEILGEHCKREGRDYASIEKTMVTRFDPGPSGERADQEVERLGRFSEIGVQAALGYLVGCEDPRVMEAMATKVIPQLERHRTTTASGRPSKCVSPVTSVAPKRLAVAYTSESAMARP